jgi:hypothetical protein
MLTLYVRPKANGLDEPLSCLRMYANVSMRHIQVAPTCPSLPET